MNIWEYYVLACVAGFVTGVVVIGPWVVGLWAIYKIYVQRCCFLSPEDWRRLHE